MVQSSDVPALLRAKAELEARCQVMQSQLQRLQGALETADTEKGLMQDSIDTVIKSGDVGLLAGLKERLRAGTARMSPTRRMFRRKPSIFKPDAAAPSQVSRKDGGGTRHILTVDESSCPPTRRHHRHPASQDAERSGAGQDGRSHLRLQIARMSKRQQRAPKTGAAAEGLAAAEHDLDEEAGGDAGSQPRSEGSLNMLEDAEVEARAQTIVWLEKPLCSCNRAPSINPTPRPGPCCSCCRCETRIKC
jgi:hypothetical protein